MAVTREIAEAGWIERISPEKRLIHGKMYQILKRAMDVLVVVSTLPITLLLIGLCSLLIKVGNPRSPVYFSHIRTGQNGRLFQMYKLRTMVPNAEEIRHNLSHINQRSFPDFKLRDDPRITRVGSFLRKSGLDELPQIVNVLRGDMSLVGPRPTSFFQSEYEDWQRRRLNVKPGITGLWQVIRENNGEFERRVSIDIAYIERRCLWLDIQILMRTVRVVLSGKGDI